MIKKFVQFFVGVINTQLLEGVDGEIFKTKNVEHAQESRRVLTWIDAIVDVIDQPGERSGIQGFRHRMSVFSSLKNMLFLNIQFACTKTFIKLPAVW